MKNKKIISIILLVLFCVTLNVLFFYNDNMTKKYEISNINNSISVMVYDNTTSDYVKQNNIPTGNYKLNRELSYCENKGEIKSYNNSTGKVVTKIKGTDKCYFYFDISLTASDLDYENNLYTDCTTVQCALDEIAQEVIE